MQFSLRSLVYLAYLKQVFSGEHTHNYRPSSPVAVWTNVVGPIHNNQETYPYFYLPYCKGEVKVDHYHESIGERLLGYQPIGLGIDLKFDQNQFTPQVLCSKVLDKDDLAKFHYAIENNYWYQLFIDGLTNFTPVGKLVLDHSLELEKLDHPFQQGSGNYLYTETRYTLFIDAKKTRILGYQVRPANPLKLDKGLDHLSVQFNYTVSYEVAPDLEFADRVPYHQSLQFSLHQGLPTKLISKLKVEHKVRWLSVCNSLLLILILLGVLASILIRILKLDLKRYNQPWELDGGWNSLDEPQLEGHFELVKLSMDEETGWKLVANDVFRPPKRLLGLAVGVGTGIQIFSTTTLALLATILNHWSHQTFKIVSCSLLLYSLTSSLSGYLSTKVFISYLGKGWIYCGLLTATLWPLLLFSILCLVNTVAWSHQSTRALSLPTFLILVGTWACLTLPLTLFGASLARRHRFQFPCRVNALPRPIPLTQWYGHPLFLTLLGGMVPFLSMFIELYYIFNLFWNNPTTATFLPYHLYGFLLLSLLLLVTLASLTGILITYVQVNHENYRWHWLSFGSTASTGIYLFLYAIYYFWVKTKMDGLLQISFYFFGTLVFSTTLALILGSVSYLASQTFLLKIFKEVKLD